MAYWVILPWFYHDLQTENSDNHGVWCDPSHYQIARDPTIPTVGSDHVNPTIFVNVIWKLWLMQIKYLYIYTYIFHRFFIIQSDWRRYLLNFWCYILGLTGLTFTLHKEGPGLNFHPLSGDQPINPKCHKVLCSVFVGFIIPMVVYSGL